MTRHVARIAWEHDGPPDVAAFRRGRYSRAHSWQFDGGLSVSASSSPDVIPVPWSTPEAIDPEEAFVAAIASCHMMSFLYCAGRAGYALASYTDEAVGTLGRTAEGRRWIERVVLQPRIVWADGHEPSAAEVAALHDAAHAECFIANSVATAITVENAAL